MPMPTTMVLTLASAIEPRMKELWPMSYNR